MSGQGGSYYPPNAAASQGYAPQPQHPRQPMAQGSHPPPHGYYQPPSGTFPQQQQQQPASGRPPYQQAPPSYGSPAPPAGVPYTNPQGAQQVYAPRAVPQQPYYSAQQQQAKRPVPQARAPAQGGSSRPAGQQQQQQHQPAYPQTSYLPPQHVLPPKQPHRDPHRYATLPAPAPLPAYTIQGQAGQTAPAPGATSAGPLPLFAPIANPRNRNAQACFTSYASRLRTGVSLLMQPILASSAPAQGAAGASSAPQSGRRRGAVNYAENDKDVTDESESDSESEAESVESKEEADGNYGGRVGRTAVKSKKLAGPPAKGGMGSGGTKGSGLERSYLGELPPVEKVVVKPAQKTRHSYYPTEALEAAAEMKETLVPVRIDIDTDTHRIRDAFLWNINESLSTPDEFAQIFCHDLELPAGTHAAHVAAQIRAQLDEFKGVAEMDVEYTGEHVPVDEDAVAAEAEAAAADEDDDAGEAATAKELEQPTEATVPPPTQDISIVIDAPAEDAVPAPAAADDNADADADDGDRKRKREDGDEGEGDDDDEADEVEEVEQEEEAVIDESVQESDCRIIVNLDVQLSNYSLRDRIEWDLSSPLIPATFAASLCADLGLPSSSVPLLTHAIHEELLRHKKDCLELGFVGAGWSSGQGKTQGGKVVGPRGLEGAWRGWEEGSEFEPVLREVDEDEMEKREAERERSSRRMRRETARFTTGTGNRRRR